MCIRDSRNVEPGYYSNIESYTFLFLGLSIVLILTFNGNQVYNIRRSTSWVDEVYRLANGVFVGTIIVMAATFGLRPLAFSRLLFLYDAVLIIGFLGFARGLRRYLEFRLRAKGINVVNLLIVGAGDIGLAVMLEALAKHNLGYRVVGLVDNDSEKGITDYARI